MSQILPENILRLIDPKDRKPMGKAGLTASESQAKGEAVAERLIAKEYTSWLNLHGIKFIRASMNRRVHDLNPGWPDVTCFYGGKVLFVELKTMTGKERPEQLAFALWAGSNGFTGHVCRSTAQAIEVTRKHFGL